MKAFLIFILFPISAMAQVAKESIEKTNLEDVSLPE